MSPVRHHSRFYSSQTLGLLAAQPLAHGSVGVRALHPITFENYHGTPTLDRIPSNLIATGTGMVYQNATVVNVVAFLQTGFCGPNGGNCTSLDINLGESNGLSSAVVDLIPTHEFSVGVTLSFYNACCGAGASCLDEYCINAIRQPEETYGVVNCTAEDDPSNSAGLLVTWCPESASSTGLATPTCSSTASTSSSSSQSASTSASTFQGSSKTSGSGGSAVSGSTTAVSDANASHKSPVGPIVGGVVGGVGGLALLALLALLFFRHRRSRANLVKPNIDEDPYLQPEPYLMNEAITTALPPTASAKSFLANASPMPAPMPLPHTPAAPSSVGTSSASQSEARTVPDLDQIVEGLANRFGWTAPPHPGEAASDDLPEYPGAHV